MASLEDYDEFGNYIGADLDSDEDDEPQYSGQQQQQQAAPLEGFDMDVEEDEQNALMVVDGTSASAHAQSCRIDLLKFALVHNSIRRTKA